MQTYLLVDCNGMLCKDGGKLDINTCKCSCTSPLYYGDQCEKRRCGTKECQNGGDLNPETCVCQCKGIWGGDVCEQKICGGKVCQNGGTLDTNTCTCACQEKFSGDQCEIGELLLFFLAYSHAVHDLLHLGSGHYLLQGVGRCKSENHMY